METWKSIPPAGPLLKVKQAAAFIGVSRGTYYNLVARGLAPPPIKFFDGINAASGVPIGWLNAAIAAAANRGVAP